MKTEKQINNSIYLMNIIAELYMQKHKLSIPEFLDLNSKTGLLGFISECSSVINSKTGLLGFISECSSVFDGLPPEEMLNEAEEYISEQV